jgi:hypothetical protein
MQGLIFRPLGPMLQCTTTIVVVQVEEDACYYDP